MTERMNRFVPVIVLLILVCLVSACLPAEPEPTPTPTPTPTPGEMQKDFTLQTVEGESFTLGDHLGRPIVVSFFRPGCRPCQRQIAPLNAIYAEYQDTQNLLVLGVGAGTPAVIAAYVDNNDITYPVVVDSAWVASNLYGVSAIPRTFFINWQGEIVRSPLGFLSEAELESYLAMIW